MTPEEIRQKLSDEADAMWSKGEATADEASCARHFINRFAELIKTNEEI